MDNKTGWRDYRTYCPWGLSPGLCASALYCERMFPDCVGHATRIKLMGLGGLWSSAACRSDACDRADMCVWGRSVTHPYLTRQIPVCKSTSPRHTAPLGALQHQRAQGSVFHVRNPPWDTIFRRDTPLSARRCGHCGASARTGPCRWSCTRSAGG